MEIKFEENDGVLVARLSELSDWKLFESIANEITHEFDGSWIKKLDGLDQRYWDVKINDCELTLHLEHYLGIMLFPTSKTSKLKDENELVKRIADYLAKTKLDEEAS